MSQCQALSIRRCIFIYKYNRMPCFRNDSSAIYFFTIKFQLNYYNAIILYQLK